MSVIPGKYVYNTYYIDELLQYLYDTEIPKGLSNMLSFEFSDYLSSSIDKKALNKLLDDITAGYDELTRNQLIEEIKKNADIEEAIIDIVDNLWDITKTHILPPRLLDMRISTNITNNIRKILELGVLHTLISEWV